MGDSVAIEPVRERVHGMWASVAEAWGAHADHIDEHAAAMTARMLELTAPSPGERVLELACGPGGLGLEAAERVLPGGEVVLSDVAAEMTAIARERAAARGLENVRTRELDLEEIDEPDAAFDVVLCREGLMFALDPARAAAEIRRVLRPGGRFALSVWAARERNPWLGTMLDATSEELGVPVPPPGVPGPFSLPEPDRLAEVLSAGGLSDVSVEEADVPRGAASFDDWWQRTSALAGPLAKVLSSLPEEARAAIRSRVEQAAVPYTAADGSLRFPGVALLASGVRG